MKRDVPRTGSTPGSVRPVWCLALLLAMACDSPVTAPGSQPHVAADAVRIPSHAALIAIDDVLERVVPTLPAGNDAAAIHAWLSVIRNHQRSGDATRPDHAVAQIRQALERAGGRVGGAYWPELDAIRLAVLEVEGNR